jgi:hypothetical protein
MKSDRAMEVPDQVRVLGEELAVNPAGKPVMLTTYCAPGASTPVVAKK